MRDSEAYYHSDAGFYIGQTPAQDKPIRSIVDNIESWGNPLGCQRTNMRYVTITDSRFYNNAVGVVPNALDSEKFPPAEDNIIRDNEIFWNNFNFHEGAPFKPQGERHRRRSCPVGTGLLLLGGRRNIVENNSIYGNYAVGVARDRGLPARRRTRRRARSSATRCATTQFGLGGTDLNGRELAYDGNGTRQLLRRATPGVVGDDPGRRLDARRRARSPARTRSTRRRRPRCCASPGEAARRAVDQAPARAQAGLQPLELYKP